MTNQTLTEAEMDTILVRQKDRILSLLNTNPPAALAALEVVAEMWRDLGYEYKTREILARSVCDVDARLKRIYAR